MITIVTDSTAYFSKSEAEKLGIVCVPLIYKTNGREYLEDFGTDCTANAEFLNKSSTEEASVAIFRDVFEKSVEKGEVLCILISSRLSGSYHNACLAAKDFNGKVTVIDSLLTAGGLKLLIEETYNMIESAKSLKDLADKVEKIKPEFGIAFSVDNMNPLKKSGRLGFVRQSIGSALNMKPILKCENGTVVSKGVSRGSQDRIRKIVSFIPEDAKKIIVNCDFDNKQFEEFKAYIHEKFSKIPVEYNSLGPVLLVHLGKGVLAVSWKV